MLLGLKSIEVTFGKKVIFANVDLELNAGDSIAIMGKSGVGKTSLLNIILGLNQPNSGEVYLDGKETTSKNSEARAKIRRENIGSVFQNGELIPQLTAVENVALPLLLAKKNSVASFREAKELLTSLEVLSLDIAANRLSGGERQRVALARALIHRPVVIVADEPTGNLDEETRTLVSKLLFNAAKERGGALLVVTHDQEVAALADRSASLTPQGLVWHGSETD